MKQRVARSNYVEPSVATGSSRACFCPATDEEPSAKWLMDLAEEYCQARGLDQSEHTPRRVPLSQFKSRLSWVIRAGRSLPQSPMSQAGLARILSNILETDIGQSFISKTETICSVSLERLGALGLAFRLPPSVLIVAAELSLRSHPKPDDGEVSIPSINWFLQRAADWLATHSVPAAAVWQKVDSGAHLRLSDAVGTALTLFRVGQGLSQAKLVREVHDFYRNCPKIDITITPATLAQLENGHTAPSWERLAELNQVLRVSMRDVFVEAERQLFLLLDRSLNDLVAILNQRLQELQQLKDNGIGDGETVRQLLAKIAVTRRAAHRQLPQPLATLSPGRASANLPG